MINKLENIELLKSVFEFSIESILVVNVEGSIVMCNSSSERIFGYKPGELLNKNINSLIPKTQKQSHETDLKTYVKYPKLNVVSRNLDIWGIRKDTTKFCLDISLNPTLVNGESYTIVYLRDATSRRNDLQKIQQANLALKESNRKFDVLINNQKGIIFRCKNNRNYELEYISEGCFEITGYSNEAFNTKVVTLAQLINKEDLEHVRSAIEKAIGDKKDYDVKYRIQHKNNITKYIWEKGIPICNNHSEVIAIEGFIIDITFQKELEHSLKHSIDKNNALLRAIPDIMLTQDFKRNYLDYYTPKTEQLALQSKKIIGKNMSDVLPLEVFNNVRSAYHETIKNNQIHIVIHQLKLKDETQYYELRIVPLNDYGILIIVRNITKENTNQLLLDIRTSALASASNSILIVDAPKPGLPIIYCNEAFEKKTDYSKMKVYERNCLFLQNDNKDQKEINIMKTAIKREKNCSVVLRKYKKNGNMFWNEVSITPVKSSNKEIIGTIGIYFSTAKFFLNSEKNSIKDVRNLASVAIAQHQNRKKIEVYTKTLEAKVERRTHKLEATVEKLKASNLNLEDQIVIAKQAEQKSVASRALTYAIAKNFPKGIIIVINKNLKYELVEGEILSQIGINQIYTGMSLEDVTILSEGRKKRIKKNIAQTLSGENLSFDIKFRNIYFSVNTMPLIGEDGQINSVLFVYIDVTEKKRIEFNMRLALEKEKQLNKLKSRFIAMASHEFRNPLSAIMTSAILIGKQNEPGNELKREKYINQIEKNIRNLVVILNDFLSLSKLEEGKVATNNERFDLIQFFKALINETQKNLKNKQTINLVYNMNRLIVALDSKLLHLVFINLISNASKYSSDNSTIILAITQNNKYVTIKVIDQGIGIPEEDHKHLFERFFRARNVANIEGTGLGLNIVKQYVELMKGIIGFKTKVNIGSTFWVKLPTNIE